VGYLAGSLLESDQSVARFGEFEADLVTGELRRDGQVVKLQRQPFEALALLLRARGGLVSREVFRRTLWPAAVHVDFDRGLTSAIRKVREALGDSGRTPRFIETRLGRGYRFICPVQFCGAAPARAIAAPDPAVLPGSGVPRRVWVAGRAAAWVGIAVAGAVLVAAAGWAFTLP